MTARSDDDLLRAARERLRQVIEAELERETRQSDMLITRIVPKVRHAVEAARQAGEVEGRLWLIGSYAFGKPTLASDIDLLVEGSVDRDAFLRRLEEAVGLDVDLIALEDADEALLPHLMREGVSL